MNQRKHSFLNLLKELELFSETTAIVYNILILKGNLSKLQIMNQTSKVKEEIDLSLKHLVKLRLVNRNRDHIGFRYYGGKRRIGVRFPPVVST
jgi:hypothetical protein